MLHNGFQNWYEDCAALTRGIKIVSERKNSLVCVISKHYLHEDPGNELGIIQDGRDLHAMGYFRCGKNRP